MFAGQRRESSRGCVGARQFIRRQDREQRIHLRIVECRARRRHELPGIRMRRDEDGMRARHLQPAIAGMVRGERARSTGVRHDSEPAPVHPYARAERGGGTEEVREVADAQHAGAAHGRIEHVVPAHQRARVERRGLGALGVTPGLHDHHGLHSGGGPERAHEAARVVDTLRVQHDAVGRGIVDEEVEDLAQPDVQAEARRDDGGEADVARPGPVEHRRAERPGLRDEREAARLRMGGAAGRIQLQVRADEPEAARTEHADGVLARGLLQFRPERPSGLVAVLETRGDDDGAADALCAAFADDARHGARRRHDDRGVDGLGQVEHAAESRPAGDLGVRRVHELHGPREAGRRDVAPQEVAQRAGAVARPHQDQGAWTQQGFDASSRHDSTLDAHPRAHAC